MKYYYPAIFHRAESKGSGFWIEFPDLDGAFTEGDNMDEAYKMAEDCLGLTLSYLKDEGKEFPKPSTPDKIDLKNDDILVIVSIDLLQYEKRINSRSVKKTLSIPEWLNDEAIKHKINFSKMLQEALIEKLRDL